MLKKTIALLTFCALALPMGAYADASVAPSSNNLKDGCENPARVGNQIAPADISIMCADALTQWRQDSLRPGTAHYSSTASAITNKGNVGAPPVVFDNGIPSAPECRVYVEETHSRNNTYHVTCEEIKPLNYDVQAYCAQMLQQAEMTITPTGRRIDTCASQPTTSANLSGRP